MSAVAWLERLRDAVADRGRGLGLGDGEALPEHCRRLVAGRGEATNVTLAREILPRDEFLDHDAQTAFLVTLVKGFGPEADVIRRAVAGFHLANGAMLERIDVYADRSERAMSQSYGVMVNSRYDADPAVTNHEAFVQHGRIMISRSLQREFDRHVGT